jgi:hypothetical protein
VNAAKAAGGRCRGRQRGWRRDRQIESERARRTQLPIAEQTAYAALGIARHGQRGIERKALLETHFRVPHHEIRQGSGDVAAIAEAARAVVAGFDDQLGRGRHRTPPVAGILSDASRVVIDWPAQHSSRRSSSASSRPPAAG